VTAAAEAAAEAATREWQQKPNWPNGPDYDHSYRAGYDLASTNAATSMACMVGSQIHDRYNLTRYLPLSA
jgi:hypothetical protein